MKIRLTMDMEVPDGYFLEGEYEAASIQQTVWDHTVKELHVHNLTQAVKSYKVEDEKMREAMINHYHRWAEIFNNCQYKIEKITD